MAEESTLELIEAFCVDLASAVGTARQRPGTASGGIFLTLEDETGVSNVIVWRKTYETFRKEVIAGRLLRVTGRIEHEQPLRRFSGPHCRSTQAPG